MIIHCLININIASISMVIYFVLGLLFAMFCVFVNILYQANILPLQNKNKNIINEIKQHNIRNNIDNNVSFLLEIFVPPLKNDENNYKMQITKTIDFNKFSTHEPTTTTTTLHNTKRVNFEILKLFNVRIFIDEDLSTMIFKIPNENYINGIHIINTNCVFTLIIIHKENIENLENIKIKINDELENLKNVYEYTNNAICIFDNHNVLVESLGEVQEKHNTFTNTNNYFIEFNSTKHTPRSSPVLFNTVQQTLPTHPAIPPMSPKLTVPELPMTPEPPVPMTPELVMPTPSAPPMPTSSSMMMPYTTPPIVPPPSMFNSLGFIPENENYSDNTIFQDKKEIGFKHIDSNTLFKKNVISNSTINMFTNFKNALF